MANVNQNERGQLANSRQKENSKGSLDLSRAWRRLIFGPETEVKKDRPACMPITEREKKGRTPLDFSTGDFPLPSWNTANEGQNVVHLSTLGGRALTYSKQGTETLKNGLRQEQSTSQGKNR